MNEYLTTALGDEHRRTLLDEARANGLARIAREGHPTFWQHLAEALGSVVRGRWPVKRADVHTPAHHLAH